MGRWCTIPVGCGACVQARWVGAVLRTEYGCVRGSVLPIDEESAAGEGRCDEPDRVVAEQVTYPIVDAHAPPINEQHSLQGGRWNRRVSAGLVVALTVPPDHRVCAPACGGYLRRPRTNSIRAHVVDGLAVATKVRQFGALRRIHHHAGAT